MSNGGGLKQQWGVKDPQVCSAGSGPQAVKFNAGMKANLDTINQGLQYTVENAEKPKHEAMAGKRDKLIQDYQDVIPKIDPEDESKAKSSIDAVLSSAKGIAAEAKAFKTATEKSLKAWQAKQLAFDKAVIQVEELEKWEDKDAPELRKLATGTTAAVNERRYDDAVQIFQQLLVSLKPVYEQYQKQQAAKTAYDTAWNLLKPRLEQALGGQPASEEIKTAQWEISNERLAMENAAEHKDYVSAKERLDKLPAALDKLKKMLRELYEKTWKALQKQLPTTSQKGSPKEAELAQQLVELCKKVESTSASGDYVTALNQIEDVEAKLKELTAEHEAYEKRKKDFETRFAGMKEALDTALGTKTDVKEVKATQDAVKAKKTDVEKAATAGDYASGMTRLDELDAALKAHQEELRKSPQECDWVRDTAMSLQLGIHIKYIDAHSKIIDAATDYDAALKEHTDALKKLAAAKELATNIVVGIFFAGLGGAVGGAVGGGMKSAIEDAFGKAAASGAIIDATKDVAKFTTRSLEKFGGKAGDPTAGLPGVGGSGTDLARKMAKAVNAQGVALLSECKKLIDLVRGNPVCKEGPVRVEGDPTKVLDSDPFLKVLGTIKDVDKKVFAKLLWGQWINAYAYDVGVICKNETCRHYVDSNVDGIFAWWTDLRKKIVDQAGEDFGLQAKLDAARAEMEKTVKDLND